jgi:hypothetical protein
VLIVFALLAIMVLLGNTDTVQWDNAKRQNSVKSYKSYLDRNPHGPHKAEALTLLKQAAAKEASFLRIARDDPESNRAWTMVQDTKKSRTVFEKYSDKYALIGVRAVEKKVGGVFKMEMVPALFIYVLQNRADPHRVLVSVSQSHGNSIAEVLIGGSAFNSQTRIKGDGIYWGDRIPSSFSVPDKTYEKEVVVSNLTDGVVGLTVSYSWISTDIASGKFTNVSEDTRAVFALRSDGG